MSALPTAPAGTIVYEHPQGKTIYVHPDGSMVCWKPDGRRGSSSATPEKLAAGYGGWILVSGTAPAPYVAPSPALEEKTTARGVRIPMTYGSAEIDDLLSLAADPDVVLEQKLDGTRCLAVITRKPDAGSLPFVRFLGRNGQQLKHAAAAKHFTNLAESLRALLQSERGEIVLDGEIMDEDGIFWVFDMPYAETDGGDTQDVGPTEAWAERRLKLADVGDRFAELSHDNVRLVPTAIDHDDKVRLIDEVEAAGGEGLMIKNAYAPYQAGVRVTHSLKVKYVRTADVVVHARDVKGAKNAVLIVYNDDGSPVLMGNCSMIGKPDAEVGDVIEVKYLYLGAGGKLYQPRMERIRDDREPSSCTMDQFRTYSKAVIA